jgi:uncharacterized C2H2 Zn-finger protein
MVKCPKCDLEFEGSIHQSQQPSIYAVKVFECPNCGAKFRSDVSR